MAAPICALAELVCVDDQEGKPAGTVSFGLDWCSGATEIHPALASMPPLATLTLALREPPARLSSPPKQPALPGRSNVTSTLDDTSLLFEYGTSFPLRHMADGDDDDDGDNGDAAASQPRTEKPAGWLCPVVTDDRGRTNVLFTTRKLQLHGPPQSPHHPVGKQVVVLADGSRVVAAGTVYQLKSAS